MLWTVFLIFIVIWILGLPALLALGGFIHLALLFALVTLAIDVFQERRL
jgi:Zn-dependent membrane protease YugP